MLGIDKVRRNFYGYRCKCGTTNYMLVNEAIEQPDPEDPTYDLYVLRAICVGCGQVTKLYEKKVEIDPMDQKSPYQMDNSSDSQKKTSES